MKSTLVLRVSHLVIVFMVVAAGILFATYTMFSGFRLYDDEGYMMITIQQMLEGHPLYGDASVPYGPFYYLLMWGIHGGLGVPLSHDAVRITTIAAWTAGAAIFSLVAYRLCRRSLLSMSLEVLCFAACTLHLQAISNEPGHPQEVLLILLGGCLLVGSFVEVQREGLIAFLLGCCSGAILLTKVNVGVFIHLAVLLAMLPPNCVGWSLRILRWFVMISALVIPLILLRAHLDEMWAQWFCASVIVALLSCSFVGNRQTHAEGFRPHHFVKFGLGSLSVVLLCVGFVMFRGGTPGGMVESIFLKALRFPAVFGWPLLQPTFYFCLVLAGGLAAGFYLLPQPPRRRNWIDETCLPALKLLVGIGILYQACGLHSLVPVEGQKWPFSFAAGFFWLILIVPAGGQVHPHENFLRRLIAFTSCLNLLQMYPVPGTQMYIGTITVVVLGVVLIGDAGSLLESVVKTRWLFGGVTWLRAGALGLGLLVLGLSLARARTAKRAYYSVQEVQLEGSRFTRMPEEQATTYRCLADTIQASANTFVCRNGLNSLYFWSHTRPASTVPISHAWQLFDASQQRMLLEGNRAVPSLVFIDHPGLVAGGGFSLPAAREIPLLQFVQQEMRARFRIGEYKLYTRKSAGEMHLRSCAFFPEMNRHAPAPHEARTIKLKEFPGANFQVHDLHVSIPEGQAGVDVNRIDLVDLDDQSILCRTSSGDVGQIAVLLGLRGEVLLPRESGSVSVPANSEEWTLAIPSSVDLNAPGLPAIRFYDGNKRHFTIPVAVGLRGGS